LGSKAIGDIGEEIATNMPREHKIVISVAIKNASNNGIDIIAKFPDGRFLVFEVKTTVDGIIKELSARQSDMGWFIQDVARQAARK
jgi:hypothetical protein